MKRDVPPAAVHVRIYLRGGIVQGVEALDGQQVYIEVFDYDTEGMHDEDLARDDDGQAVWRYTC